MTAEEYKAKQKDISDQINELKKQSLELEHLSRATCYEVCDTLKEDRKDCVIVSSKII